MCNCLKSMEMDSGQVETVARLLARRSVTGRFSPASPTGPFRSCCEMSVPFRYEKVTTGVKRHLLAPGTRSSSLGGRHRVGGAFPAMRGFSRANMRAFAEAWPDDGAIVQQPV